MNEPLNLKPEQLERTVRLRTQNDSGEQAGLVLSIPSREGGAFTVPVLDDWGTLEEKPEGELGNTLMSVCPVAEIHRNRPMRSGGVTIYGGRAVAMLRPGYLYVFRGQTLWREFEIGPQSLLSEVDLVTARNDKTAPRLPVGEPVTDFLVPVFLSNRFELTDCRIAYSEIQWSWSYIEQLEGSPADLEQRALAIAPAWAAATADELTFDSGFPASGIQSVPGLRPRDLGIELMLEDPARFTPAFQKPGDEELISRTVRRWDRIPAASGDTDTATPDLNLEAEPTQDPLAGARVHPAIVCVALPDPLFRFRHALAQLHLALHYLDAIDLSLKDQPLIHSATLIRQALFDSRAPAADGQFDTLRAAIDREKLDKTLDQDERRRVLEDMTTHLNTLDSLVANGEFDSVCNDYLRHDDLGPCEAFALQADLLNLAQQLPGVLNAHGLEAPAILTRLLRQGLTKNPLIAAMADSATGEYPQLLTQLRELAADQETLTEERLNGIGLSSLGALAQHLNQEGENTSAGSGAGAASSAAGKATGMIEPTMGGWSAAVLKAVESLRQDGQLASIKLDRVFTSVTESADIADPHLAGELQVMHRGDVDLTRYSIVGVHGNGVSFGLTDADRQSEALTRRNDYLFADRTDAAGQRVASTSPGRLVDEGGETLVKTAAHTWVFVLPIDHPEALKFSALRIDWANKARAIADGPGLSRVLVGLAAYNLVSEILSSYQSDSGRNGIGLARSMGGFLDLTVAVMKLYIVTSPVDARFSTKVILRPLFEIRSIPLIGPVVQKRLLKVGAGTIVRTMGLFNFLSGVFMVGISAWDYHSSLSQGDLDAAVGHGLAVVGGSVFLASPLLAGLLAVPGWGWALFGLGVVLGGSVFAAIATDSVLERVLKQGPLGIGPEHEGLPADDSVYYSQLLSQLCPLTVSAQRFGELSNKEQAMFADDSASSGDFRITVRCPL